MDGIGIGMVSVCLWIVTALANGQDYVNVASGKTCDQNNDGGSSIPSNRAANGDTSDNYPANCILTDDAAEHSWWEVDLGRTYPLCNISIWAGEQYKHRIYPSTITVDREICTVVTSFPDDTREKQVMCSDDMYGQKVRIAREKSVQYDDYRLFMCEMEIWVPREVSQCPAGRYGTACDLNCNEHCGKGPGKNFCYQSSGHCYDGCVAGWYGDQCSTACSRGCQTSHCDQETGECAPCFFPYTGPTCSECQDGYYDSRKCERCSLHCQSQSCDSQTGKCNGCADGLYGDMCASVCPAANCLRCDQQSGECEECVKGGNLQLPDCIGYYASKSDEDTDNQSTIIIASTVGAGLFFNGLCIIIVGIIWVFRSKTTSP